MSTTRKMAANGDHQARNVYSDKLSSITDKLQRREDGRQEDIQRKRSEKENISVANESTQYFNDHFKKEVGLFEDQLSKSEKLEKSELVEYFDNLSVFLTKIQKFVADSTMFLPSYDVRHAGETANKLQNELQLKREELLPRKRFAFKVKRKDADSPALQTQKTPDKENMSNQEIELAECQFVDVTGENLEKHAVEINSNDVSLARLTDCTIKLYGAPSALHIIKLKNCKIFCGPVSGSVFITDCPNCIFVLGCQQLRVHTTTSTDFYIHVTSRAIIEDSNTVRFAPFNWDYAGLQDHYKVSGLDKNRNSWNDVDDFNWLAADTHSPNWSLIEESSRIKKWD